MKKVIVTILALSILCGRKRVVWVTDKKNEDAAKSKKVDGIPFYVKTEQFRQTTVLAKTWLTATLTVEKKSIDTTNGKEAQNEASKQVLLRQLLKSDNNRLNSIRASLITANNKDLKDALKIVSDFENLPSISDDSKVTPVLIKNDIQSEWVVDRSRQYYLNAPLPWFGTGNLSQELNADGTLSKASSSSDTKLAEGISTLLPLKELLSGKFLASAASAAKDTAFAAEFAEPAGTLKSSNPKLTQKETQYAYALTLTVEEGGYQYTLTKPPGAMPSPVTPLKLDGADVLISRTDLKSGDSVMKKEDGQKVGITGSIDFPKDWGATKAPQK